MRSIQLIRLILVATFFLVAPLSDVHAGLFSYDWENIRNAYNINLENVHNIDVDFTVPAGYLKGKKNLTLAVTHFDLESVKEMATLTINGGKKFKFYGRGNNETITTELTIPVSEFREGENRIKIIIAGKTSYINGIRRLEFVTPVAQPPAIAQQPLLPARPAATPAYAPAQQQPPVTAQNKPVQAGQSLHRIALVIGNGSYRGVPLRNPVNDAKAVSAALRNQGFDVTTLTDADQRRMEQAISTFSKKSRDAVAFFFYAGHGMQVDGENFLVPIRAQIKTEGDVRYEAVSAGRVLDNLRHAGSKLNIVVLDACRDNPVARSFRSGSRGLANINAPRGTIIAFSTAPGDVAADGTGVNSPYATAFVKHVGEQGLPVETFFKKVARDVDTTTGGKQRPWISSDFLGEFSFSMR